MNRQKAKKQVRNTLTNHFKFFWQLFLPYIVLSIITEVLNQLDYDYPLGFYLPIGKFHYGIDIYDRGVGLLLMICGYLLITGIMFICIDLVRGKGNYQHPIHKSAYILDNGQYFIGTLMIGILKSIWAFLWTLLFIIPGFIKQLAYSQAPYIYRDALDHQHPIGYREAITRSRYLMKGHKWELFVLQLSFLGWFIISLITFGLANFWVTPYYRLTLAHFYQSLINS